MSDWTDHLLVQALRTASSAFSDQAALGRLIWTTQDGSRAYVRGGTLAIVRHGCTVVEYCVDGVDLDDVV